MTVIGKTILQQQFEKLPEFKKLMEELQFTRREDEAKLYRIEADLFALWNDWMEGNR